MTEQQRPKFGIGDRVLWTNGTVGKVVDGPFDKGLCRVGAGAEPMNMIYKHHYGYIVEFEDAQKYLGDKRCAMLPEGALRPEWMSCSGEHRQAEDGTWERRKAP